MTTKVTNVWAIYWNDQPGGEHYAEFSRPQDWGDPKYMYRVYEHKSGEYESTCHCYVDHQMSDDEHKALFAPLVEQILYPGVRSELAGREFLDDDDFWNDAWGAMPSRYDAELDEFFDEEIDDDFEELYDPNEEDEEDDDDQDASFYQEVGMPELIDAFFARAITSKVLSDKRPLAVTIDMSAAWLIVTALQLTVRHPGIHEPLRQELTHIALQFQDRIIEEHPEAEHLLKAGWDTAHDVG